MANNIKIDLAEVHRRLVSLEDHYWVTSDSVNKLLNKELQRPAIDREMHTRCFALDAAVRLFNAETDDLNDFEQYLEAIDYYLRNGELRPGELVSTGVQDEHIDFSQYDDAKTYAETLQAFANLAGPRCDSTNEYGDRCAFGVGHHGEHGARNAAGQISLLWNDTESEAESEAEPGAEPARREGDSDPVSGTEDG